MKLVAVSDLHLDVSSAGLVRLPDIAAAVTETVDVAIATRADAWMFLGDAMNPDSGAVVFSCLEVLVRAVMRLKRAGIRVILLSGNHDVVESGSGATTLTPLRPLAGPGDAIYLFERPGIVEFEDHLLLALPYTASSHPYNPAELASLAVEQAKTWEKPLVVIGHLMLEGMHPGSETTDYPRGRDIFWPLKQLEGSGALLLGGHYHRRQLTQGVQIIGSLARLTHGEADHTPGYLVVDC